MIGSSCRHARVYYRGIDAVRRALLPCRGSCVATARGRRGNRGADPENSRRGLADEPVTCVSPDGDAHARVHSGDRWTSADGRRALLPYVSSDWDMVEGATSLYDSSQRHVELDSRSGDHGDHRSVMPLPTFSKYPGLTF